MRKSPGSMRVQALRALRAACNHKACACLATPLSYAPAPRVVFRIPASRRVFFPAASNMPNKTKRNKRRSSRLRPLSPRSDSVKDLLAGAHPALARLSEQAARQELWDRWLALHLPREVAKHVSGVVERDASLVIFTSSAAWSARVRFAVAEIEGRLKSAHPRIADVAVRVLPK
jgi:hypothetical protein